MSAAALTETPSAEVGLASPNRADLLLNHEISQIQADLENLTPPARLCLQTVLRSILRDNELPPATTAAARQLLQQIAAAHHSSASFLGAATPGSG